jgi:DNA-binding transcriptional regulator YiaG
MNQWNLSRWIWTIERGEIPDGLVVRHKCDEPSCINIEHLELGTTADNSTDKVQRNRQTKGEDVVISVLTEHQVVEIRKSNNTIAEIAREYGVSYSTVRAVITGETWKHIAVESNIKPRYRNLSKRKLSQEQAEQIRADTEHTYKELAEMFGVNRGVIQRIKTGECYKV